MNTGNRFVKVAAAALCALVVSSSALSAASPAKLHEAQGTLREINPSHHQIIVAASKDSSLQRFQWNDKTEFLANSRKVTPTALKPGEKVWLTYAPGGEVPTVKKLRFVPGAKHAPARSPGKGRS